MKYIITYDDAKEICREYKDFNFSEHQFRIDGYKVSTFDYFICGYNDFNNPLPNRPEVKGFDMRGVTFVFNKDGSLWKKFLMLSKFFNLNQVESTQYANVCDKKILHISAKEDGSLVTFMMLPNGKLFSKTIRGFDNEQAVSSMKLLKDNKEHFEWVERILNLGYTPLFEYVARSNRIVLKYKKQELRLIGLRDNNTGEFVPASKIEIKIPKNLYCIKEEKDTLENLIERAKTEENKEGWVIILPNLMMKIKTVWYFQLHGIRTENIFREDYVIKNYYEEKLDDIISQLNIVDDADAFTFVNMVTHTIDKYSSDIDEKTDILKERYLNEYNADWPYFAKFCHREAYFGLSRKLIEHPDDYHRRKIEFILKKTNKLKRAKDIIERWKIK